MLTKLVRIEWKNCWRLDRVVWEDSGLAAILVDHGCCVRCEMEMPTSSEKNMFKVPKLSTGIGTCVIRLYAFLAAKNGANIALKKDEKSISFN